MKQTLPNIFWLFVAVMILAGVSKVVQAQQELDPAQSADQIFNTPSGNHVRIIGGDVPTDAVVLPTPIGDAVNVPTVPPNAVCNVVLDALPVDIKDPETGKVVRVVPGVPELAHAFGKVSRPVRIEGSEGTVGNWYWNALFKGTDCVTAADSVAYVASSIAELRPFDGPTMSKWKCRLLRAEVEVEEEVAGRPVRYMQTVEACDVRVDREKARIFVGHRWAGRTDLNFRKVQDAIVQPRVKKVTIEVIP